MPARCSDWLLQRYEGDKRESTIYLATRQVRHALGGPEGFDSRWQTEVGERDQAILGIRAFWVLTSVDKKPEKCQPDI